jgi:hypothetical protein
MCVIERTVNKAIPDVRNSFILLDLPVLQQGTHIRDFK